MTTESEIDSQKDKSDADENGYPGNELNQEHDHEVYQQRYGDAYHVQRQVNNVVAL